MTALPGWTLVIIKLPVSISIGRQRFNYCLCPNLNLREISESESEANSNPLSSLPEQFRRCGIVPAPTQKTENLRPTLFSRIFIKNDKIPGFSQVFQGVLWFIKVFQVEWETCSPPKIRIGYVHLSYVTCSVTLFRFWRSDVILTIFCVAVTVFRFWRPLCRLRHGYLCCHFLPHPQSSSAITMESCQSLQIVFQNRFPLTTSNFYKFNCNLKWVNITCWSR